MGRHVIQQAKPLITRTIDGTPVSVRSRGYASRGIRPYYIHTGCHDNHERTVFAEYQPHYVWHYVYEIRIPSGSRQVQLLLPHLITPL
jgi:hypothetical protein